MQKSKLLALLLAVALVVSMLVAPAYAAVDATHCEKCGEIVGWTDWNGTDAVEAGGHYKLVAGTAVTETNAVSGGTVCIDLNGQTLTLDASSVRFFTVAAGATLNIMDSMGGGKLEYTGDGKGVNGGLVSVTGTLNLYSGTIKGGILKGGYNGANVLVSGSGGVLNLYGGEITGGMTKNSSDKAKGVGANIYAPAGATVNIYDGAKVTDGQALDKSSAAGHGGNIYVGGNLTIYGGEISGGNAFNNGDDICAIDGAVVKVYGGNIGSLYAEAGTTTIYNGVVTAENAPANLFADCACGGAETVVAGTTYNVWNWGHDGDETNGECDCAAFETAKANVTTPLTGEHDKVDGACSICGAELNFVAGACQHHDGQNKAWKEWKQATPLSQVEAGGHWKLVEPVALSEAINPTAELCVDLNDYTLTAAEAQRVFELSNVTVSVMDSGDEGTIEGATVAANGAVVNISGSNAVFNLYDGTIQNGIADQVENGKNVYGGNIYAYGGTFNMYGGTVKNGVAQGDADKNIRGGNICIAGSGTGMITGGTIIDGTAVNGGNICGMSSATLIISDDAEIVGCVEIGGGSAEKSGDNIYTNSATASISGVTFTDGRTENADIHGPGVSIGNDVTLVNAPNLAYLKCTALAFDGMTYKTVADVVAAQQHAGTVGTVTLCADAEVDSYLEVTVSRLDLNGNTLTVNGVFDGRSATVVDSEGAGSIIADRVMFGQENPSLPVTVGRETVLEPRPTVTVVESQYNTLESDTKKFAFYFNSKANDTWMDQALMEEGNDLSVQIVINVEGQPAYGGTLAKGEGSALAEYAADWDKMAIMLTVSGVANYEVSLEVIVQSNGTIVNAGAPSSVSKFESDFDPKIKEKLSWDKINSFPVKTADMTVAEMRQLVVDFYKYSISGFVWRPDADMSYGAYEGSDDQLVNQSLVGEENYAGIPYVSKGTSNIYRMLDFMDPDTGVLNTALAGVNPRVFGNQCSMTCHWAWARVINSVKAGKGWTSDVKPSNGYIVLGGINYDESLKHKANAEANGRGAMYAAYAQLQPGDGLVTDGHMIMCTGEIGSDWRGDYVIVSEQSRDTNSKYWNAGTNDSGDSYERTGGTDIKMYFWQLYAKGYIPFTFKEFQQTDDIEETTVSFSHSGETITENQILGATVTSNYYISDIYAVVTDSWGNEVYRMAVRSTAPSTVQMTFTKSAQTSDKIPAYTIWGDLNDLDIEKKSYTVQIIAQLGTGERPVVWEGKLAK